MHPALASLPALPALFWAAGVFLRRTDALSPEDGLAAHRLLLTVLVPIVAIGLGVGARCWFLEPASRNLAALGLAAFLKRRDDLQGHEEDGALARGRVEE